MSAIVLAIEGSNYLPHVPDVITGALIAAIAGILGVVVGVLLQYSLQRRGKIYCDLYSCHFSFFKYDPSKEARGKTTISAKGKQDAAFADYNLVLRFFLRRDTPTSLRDFEIQYRVRFRCLFVDRHPSIAHSQYDMIDLDAHQTKTVDICSRVEDDAAIQNATRLRIVAYEPNGRRFKFTYPAWQPRIPISD